MSAPTALNKPIPMLDLSPQVELLWDEINEAIQRVLRSGQFILGPEVEAFEEEVATYLGVKHAIGVNSGTDALIIGLRALDIGPGDEVITTPFSFFATAESICNVGATPVFVDVEEESMNINPELIENAITEKTKAIMPVHLFGRPASMGRIMEIAKQYGLKVIEDCAQSFGARYFADADRCPCTDSKIKQDMNGNQTGSIGHIGAFSFYPTKNLGAFGDGGMITTNDDDVAELARMLQNHGSKKKYRHEMLGYNSRLDALQAAILRIKLPCIDMWNEDRRRLAQKYNEAFKDLKQITCPQNISGHCFHQYTISVADVNERGNLQVHLTDRNVETCVYYPFLSIPAFCKEVRSTNHYSIGQSLTQSVLSLPLWAGMPSQIQENVVHSIKCSYKHF